MSEVTSVVTLKITCISRMDKCDVDAYVGANQKVNIGENDNAREFEQNLKKLLNVDDVHVEGCQSFVIDEKDEAVN